MRFIFLIMLVSVLTVSLIGCSGEPKKEIHTVEWFMKPENKTTLDETLKQCNNNPGMLKDDPNCINAASARQKLWATQKAPTNW